MVDPLGKPDNAADRPESQCPFGLRQNRALATSSSSAS